MYVEVRGNDNVAFDKALAEFKRRMKRSGIMEDLRRHDHYVKPSVRRRLKRAEAHKRRRREENARARSKKDSQRRDSEGF
jgi:small subunit ribosomal protein S21